MIMKLDEAERKKKCSLTPWFEFFCKKFMCVLKNAARLVHYATHFKKSDFGCRKAGEKF
jgi:hypothetical protein